MMYAPLKTLGIQRVGDIAFLMTNNPAVHLLNCARTPASDGRQESNLWLQQKENHNHAKVRRKLKEQINKHSLGEVKTILFHEIITILTCSYQSLYIREKLKIIQVKLKRKTNNSSIFR